jgi:4-amino-4-deoxy-L-arabinose transferase-like glycosyltransferase
LDDRRSLSHDRSERAAAARLPAALSGVAVALLTRALGATLGTRAIGVRAAVVVATSPLALIFSRIAIFDMPFTAFVSLAILALVRGRLAECPTRWLPIAGLAMGLATLAKGPVGLVLPLLVWYGARGALPARGSHEGRAVALALGVYLATVAPWFLWAIHAEPGFLRYAVVDETVLRFTSPARFNRAGAFYSPLLIAVAGLGVWAAVVAATAPLVVGGRRRAGRLRRTAAFAVRATAVIIVFFSISASKRPGYVLPALVPLAILAAAGITVAGRRAATAVRCAAPLAAIVGVGVLAVCLTDSAWGIDIERRLGEAGRAVDAGVLLAAGAFLAAWGAAVVLTRRRSPKAAFALAAAFAPGLYFSLVPALDRYVNGRSTRSIAALVPSGSEVLCFRHFRPSLPFYVGHPVTLATVDGHELTSNYVAAEHERLLGDGRLISPARARERIRDPEGGVFVFTDMNWREHFGERGGFGLGVVGTDGRSTLLVRRRRETP